MSVRFLASFLLMLGCVRPAVAQPASDLLQQGIYNQETRGDLDGAIRIYRQILASGPGVRLYAAQAQYRLGVCLLRKGDITGATQALEGVIRDYPDSGDLVARARAILPRNTGLLPKPWSEAEVTEYRWNIPGVLDGWMVSRISTDQLHSETSHIHTAFYSPRPNVTLVDVENGTMYPIRASYRRPQTESGSPSSGTTLDLLGKNAHAGQRVPFYAAGEMLYLLRRMPLAVGWSTEIRLLAPGVTDQPRVITVKAAVTDTGEIEVPAGKFQCFRVRLTPAAGSARSDEETNLEVLSSTNGATLWYARDGARTLVKIQTGGTEGELVSLRMADPTGSVSYRDPRTGFTISIPSGWSYHPRAALNGPGTSVDLFDPEFQASVVFAGKSKETKADNIEAELEKGAMERLRDDTAKRKNFAMRGSMWHGRIGGHAAISWIADHSAGGVERVEYITWVQSESSRASVAVQIDARDFNKFIHRFRPILESFRIP